MKNIGEVKGCFGCGVCALSCAKDAIKIELNQDGFYTPILDANKCVNCGICTEVCAFLHNDLALNNTPKQSFGAWSNDLTTRKKCSSGGVGYELGKHLLNNRYKVCAVRYNAPGQRAEHYIATNLSELTPSIGSKYIQSYTVDGLKAINPKERYLVTGTPCQIDSFRRYIRKFRIEDSFVLMDFFCHSVPSMWAWRKYLQLITKQTGVVTCASWRGKLTGWHDSWVITINGTNNDKTTDSSNSYNSWLSKGDLFYKLFLGDYCCNSACHKSCKYKYDKSSADIRIGDFWGPTYAQNEEGVSSVIAFTEKGEQILQQLDCTFETHPFEVVAEGQMKSNVKRAHVHNIMVRTLQKESATELSIRRMFRLEFVLQLPSKIISKLYRTIWARR